MIEENQVTFVGGVPTIVAALYHYLKKEGRRLPSLRQIIVGGSALPRVLMEGFERDLGIDVVHAWGMTELSPAGSVSRLRADMEEWPEDEPDPVPAPARASPFPLVELRSRHRGRRRGSPGTVSLPVSSRPAARGSSASTTATRTAAPGSTAAGSAPATWPASTTMARFAWWTGPRTWSRAAASGSRASISRTPSWAIPRSRRPRWSRSRIPSGPSGRWRAWCRSRSQRHHPEDVHSSFSQGQGGRLVAARRRGGRRSDSQDQRRQVRQEGSAGAIQGLRASDRLVRRLIVSSSQTARLRDLDPSLRPETMRR